MQLTPTTSLFLPHARAPPPPPATRELTRAAAHLLRRGEPEPPPTLPTFLLGHLPRHPTNLECRRLPSSLVWPARRRLPSSLVRLARRCPRATAGAAQPPETNPSRRALHTATHCGVQAKMCTAVDPLLDLACGAPSSLNSAKIRRCTLDLVSHRQHHRRATSPPRLSHGQTLQDRSRRPSLHRDGIPILSALFSVDGERVSTPLPPPSNLICWRAQLVAATVDPTPVVPLRLLSSPTVSSLFSRRKIAHPLLLAALLRMAQGKMVSAIWWDAVLHYFCISIVMQFGQRAFLRGACVCAIRGVCVQCNMSNHAVRDRCRAAHTSPQ
ncbi:uncharacterized protein [Triticum aestivum]|uniref:uncharacterized protein n=1 Tax=Triticum aestivum TaxID=4565 RepID=UPI001D0147DF|nr:uncharacterized protein LOC123167623 [Triticum aestivum]